MGRKLLPKVRELFQSMDTESTGSITKEQMRGQITKGSLDLAPELADIFKPELVDQWFHIIDVDDSGDIDEDEFVSGVLQMTLSDAPMEARLMLKYMRSMRRKVAGIERYLIAQQE